MLVISILLAPAVAAQRNKTSQTNRIQGIHSHIPTINQDALSGVQISSATAQGKQSVFAVDYLGRHDDDGVRQALNIDSNGRLIPEIFFPAS